MAGFLSLSPELRILVFEWAFDGNQVFIGLPDVPTWDPGAVGPLPNNQRWPYRKDCYPPKPDDHEGRQLENSKIVPRRPLLPHLYSTTSSSSTSFTPSEALTVWADTFIDRQLADLRPRLNSDSWPLVARTPTSIGVLYVCQQFYLEAFPPFYQKTNFVFPLATSIPLAHMFAFFRRLPPRTLENITTITLDAAGAARSKPGLRVGPSYFASREPWFRGIDLIGRPVLPSRDPNLPHLRTPLALCLAVYLPNLRTVSAHCLHTSSFPSRPRFTMYKHFMTDLGALLFWRRLSTVNCVFTDFPRNDPKFEQMMRRLGRDKPSSRDCHGLMMGDLGEVINRGVLEKDFEDRNPRPEDIASEPTGSSSTPGLPSWEQQRDQWVIDNTPFFSWTWGDRDAQLCDSTAYRVEAVVSLTVR